MKVPAALLCALFVAACGSSPVATGSPATAATQSRTSSSSAPSGAAPIVAGWTPPTVASSARIQPTPVSATSCRLPYADISEASGGFITYPGGDSQPDPTSQVALPGNTPGAIGVNPGLTYDWAVGQWVPVRSDWVGPDGQFYVYQTNGIIYGVSLQDGSKGQVFGDGAFSLVGAADDGVWLREEPNLPGAWFEAYGASSKSPQKLVDHGQWQTYRDGALWSVDGSGNVIGFDVNRGTETNWGKVAPSASYIVAVDSSGGPLINTGGELTFLRPGETAATIWPGANGLAATGSAIADSHGIWFEVAGGVIGAPDTGVYLWSTGSGAKLVSRQQVHIAGVCL